MKKLLLALPLLMLSCSMPDKQNGKTVVKLDAYTPDHISRVEIEMLSEQVNQGLYKMTIDDTVHILLYRGVESVSMIQVK